ncbi:MAG: PRC-barrel domain-containing protein [Candidatus Diapherotrites archaeon]|nr:PRC-barrel domain-containing protein [Candidatus Diapherotrites archaeon]
MYKYVIARQLAMKKVISNKGEEIGRLVDILIDEKTGNLEHLIIEVDRGSKLAERLRLRNRIIEVPYSAVVAVSDVCIIDERDIAEASLEEHHHRRHAG